MNSANLRNTVILLLVAYLAIGLTMQLLLVPLLGTIQGGGPDITPTGIHAPVWERITTAIIALLSSLGAVVLTVKGIRRDRSWRWVWVILLILALFVLMNAAVATVAVPKFMQLYKDLR
jgi:hypothetical protein